MCGRWLVCEKEKNEQPREGMWEADSRRRSKMDGSLFIFWRRRVDDGLGFSFKGQAGGLHRRKKWKGADCLLEEKALSASGSKGRRESLKSGGPWL